MHYLSLLVVGMLAVPAAAAQTEVFTVGDVRNRYDELDGMRVRVAGRLGECGRERCRLHEGVNEDSAHLSIGASAMFDRRVRGLRARSVTVEGIIQARCFGAHIVHTGEEGGTLLIANCRGRSAQLANPRIVDVHPEPSGH